MQNGSPGGTLNSLLPLRGKHDTRPSHSSSLPATSPSSFLCPMVDRASLPPGGLSPASWAWRVGAGWSASLQGTQYQVCLCSPGPSFPSGLPRQREGGRENSRKGGRETMRDQSPRGRALSSPVLSFWSLSFHDPFSRRVCDLGLALSSSLASFTQHRHTH